MNARRARRAAIYARLSVTTEESVSIARQVDTATKYADARGWDVVLVATDDGVSATRNKPQDRTGWRSILDASEKFDVVIVWKVDRLARRVLDFLNADADLQSRGAALVAVEDPIDMSTAQGRAFATMLAVFGEMEAAAISARVKAARSHMLGSGRAVGARPWPYESVPHPDGAGLVWRPIPERAAAVRDAAAALTARTTSVAAVARDWSARFEAPNAATTGARSWSPASVRRLLTSPVLTGATIVGDDLLRDASGVIVRDLDRAILTPKEHADLVAAFDDHKRFPVRATGRTTHLPLLFDVAVCAACRRRLVANRPTAEGAVHRYGCQNRDCDARSSIQMGPLDAFVVAAFQAHAASQPVVMWDTEPDAVALDELTEALDATQAAIVASIDDDETASLLARRKALRAAIAEAEAAMPERRYVAGVTVGDMFEAATTDDEARAVLASVIDRVEVRRTAARRGSKVEDRVTIVWREDAA